VVGEQPLGLSTAVLVQSIVGLGAVLFAGTIGGGDGGVRQGADIDRRVDDTGVHGRRVVTACAKGKGDQGATEEVDWMVHEVTHRRLLGMFSRIFSRLARISR